MELHVPVVKRDRPASLFDPHHLMQIVMPMRPDIPVVVPVATLQGFQMQKLQLGSTVYLTI